MRTQKNIKNKRPCLILALLLLLSLILTACQPAASTHDDTTRPDSDGTVETSSDETESEDDRIPNPVDTFEAYRQIWENRNYETMYEYLTAAAKNRIDKETFISRYENIYSGIRAENLSVSLLNEQLERNTEADERYMQFQVNMDTLAGHLEISDYEVKLIYEGPENREQWKIDWTESLIFPRMQPGDKIQARILQPKRGEIYDRHNQALAVNDRLISIGIVPQSFMEERSESVAKMAEWLGLSEDRINQIVDQATVPDWFYPVVTLPAGQTDLSARLTSLPGVQYQETEGRVYPGGKATGHLVGYMGPITAEELERYSDQDYTAADQIGKMGLELVYEERLKGQRGGEIYLVDGNSNRVLEEIARKDPVHGDRIQLAIDLSIQEKIYQVMADEPGSAAAVNPITGEILALVSTPTFDSNVFQTYIPDDVRTEWNETNQGFFVNRFNAGYIPGSVFKLVTAAIGFQTGHLVPDESIPISGLHWQPSNSWGQYRVTRVRDSGAVNFREAMLYSDNIYFAMQALRAGSQDYESGAARFGLGEAMPVDYPFYRSQLANEGLNRETLLADTGYGQGEILVSSLHMALIYGTLASDGNLMKPIYELTDSTEPEVWHEQAVRSQDVPLIRDVLREVVEHPSGTAHSEVVMKRAILGKTGTAELKTSLDDEDAPENGWFIAMDIEQDSLVLAMMIENVDGRGGSRFVASLVKEALNNIFE